VQGFQYPGRDILKKREATKGRAMEDDLKERQEMFSAFANGLVDKGICWWARYYIKEVAESIDFISHKRPIGIDGLCSRGMTGPEASYAIWSAIGQEDHKMQAEIQLLVLRDLNSRFPDIAPK